MFSIVFKLFFVSLMIHLTKSDTLDDLKKQYTATVMECTQKYGLTPADVLQLREKKMPDNDNVKCMFACAYKATGMMDDKGMLSVDGVKKISEKYLSEYPEKMDNAFKFVDACQSVNDQAVSDGDRGCERAALIFKCSLEQAAVFDFD